MWGGLVLYVVGAIAALFAPTLTLMFAARFVWGLGSAGPRVAVMAMVRDAYAGEQMAKQMSFIMAVFILVPTFAPSLSAGLLLIGPWQIVFWLCAAAGVVMLLATLRLPETLADEDRIALSAREVWGSCRTVLVAPGTAGYLVSLTALFGVFLSYLASSEIILDQVFDLSDWFPVFFGGLSVAMGLGMYVNGRIVERVGLDRLMAKVFVASVVAVVGLLALALATDGKPAFWAFVAVMAAVLFLHQMLIPDLNAAAMRPLAHVAGTAAAILGMVPGVVGSIIGWSIDRQFDGSILPLAIAYAVGTAVAIVGYWWAVVATRQPEPALA
jgi:DHA1 family bicyclomycin/chloramphenicol resistance-like MFS transporter